MAEARIAATRIGLDFDGTIALYDEVFHRYAVEKFHLPRETPVSKLAVRTWFWQTPEGKQDWIELQGFVYGTRMEEARVAPGLESFLQMCRDREIHVSIISHKTELPVIGPRVNLRAAARLWLEQKGFYDTFGISRQEVFFAQTRAEKIHRIVSQRCTHFIDDLEEVFLEPDFPAEVEKLLYSPARPERAGADIKRFSCWDAIRDHFLAITH